MLTIILVFSIIPVFSILIELNYNIEFPAWLSDLEIYFKEKEDEACKLTGLLLIFRDLKDLIIAILVIAMIPGLRLFLFLFDATKYAREREVKSWKSRRMIEKLIDSSEHPDL